ncbi:LCP family protein [Streptomyces sp. NBRC 110028]|uniref:LCP family protein n=1 Tax=Streptomyces sp. NBRC 110028 TaxID=1621260 RepID=UPI00099EEEC7|nr:LCP family protein [Streptomyces sp. NBRC 110028]
MADDQQSTPVNPGRHRSRGGASSRPSGRRRRRPSARRRATHVTVLSVASVLVLGGAGAGYLYYKLNGNLTGVDVNAALGSDRPKNVDNGSMDILVLGSDSRAGKNAKYGTDEGTSRSDTAMIVHVYKGRKKASVISVPRDTLVHRPSCVKDGKETPAVQAAMFNSAYEAGGPACTIKTVEAMSGIRMDHFLEVDFSGFQQLIDDLGGVDITTTQPIHDPKSHLDLAAGPHTLNGEQSLGLVRTRHGVGDGSDLGRIKLQQAFVKALLDQIKHVDLFGNPKKLYDLANTSTKALTTDSELASVNKLSGFAKSLQGIGSGNMKMTTLPVQYDPNDPARVLPMESKTKLIWKALRADRPIPAAATKGSAGDANDAGKVVK